MNAKTWLITGISSGLGKALAEKVMESGHFVIGTFRNEEQAQDFNEKHRGRGFAFVVDFSDVENRHAAIEAVLSKFKKIDVLVNNAGYGLAGAIEETSETAVRDLFEVNFFATLALTQQLLPVFRAQKSGHIIQISSHGGFKAFAGFGIYNASKFALEGYSEALAAEVKDLGIKVTLVEPGPFRTYFAASSFKQAETVIADYQNTAGVFRERMKQVNGQQEGDPEKAAKIIFDLAQVAEPPLRLPLGKIAVLSLKSKIEMVTTDLHKFASLAESAVF